MILLLFSTSLPGIYMVGREAVKEVPGLLPRAVQKPTWQGLQKVCLDLSSDYINFQKGFISSLPRLINIFPS